MSQCRRGVGGPAAVVVAVLVAVVAITTVLAGCASSHHSAPGPAAVGATAATHAPAAKPAVTKTQVFTPYDRSGAPTAGVVAHRSGSCFARSITVAAASAYRCFAENTILDPCFAAPGSAHLLDCYASPWARAVQVRVAKLPPGGSAAHITRPWAVELSGGQRCVVTNGTAPIVRGTALGYRCNGGAAGLRGGSGDQAMSVVYRATDGAITVRAVTTAWRATSHTR